ncbi:MAG: hypothetical protein FGM54_01180 [Chitinophagaceae bacterium]|nr:hypothetical protein [Chitinophagaceae bacterium]
MVNDTMIILGHSEGGVGVTMDLAHSLLSIQKFDIVKNIDRPDCVFPLEIYNINHYWDRDYPFHDNIHLPVQFGSHHSNVKYILYHHFLALANMHRSRFKELIHPSSYIAPSVVMVEHSGIVVEPLSVISSFSKIGFGVTIKRSASVGHHANLGDFVNINPGAVLSGYVTVGSGTEIGTGVTVSNNIHIGQNCLIGVGSVVTRDIPDGVIAYGNPCKVIRVNERWFK